jgi:D-alanyl-D-alanine carboxypeptidase (penicillin-binding protein 5/6)
MLVNTNKLIRTYSGITGLKTGSTGKAGYCVAASAQRDGMQLIAVTMGSDNSNDRFNSAANLLDYGFGGWSLVKPTPVKNSYSVKVIHGDTEFVNASAGDMPTVLVAKGKEKSVQQKANVVADAEAPIEKGQVLGQISMLVDGQNVGTALIQASSAVGRMTFGKAFLMLGRCLAK